MNQSESGDSEYSETFNNEEEFTHIEKKDKVEEINLEDYKEIHEKEKFESQVNFFENSRDNYDMLNKINKNHVVNLTEKSDIGNTQGVLQDIKPYARDPKERVSRNITTFNRNKINSLYDKYNEIKNKLKDEKEVISKKDASQFLDSLNNFNQNCEKIKNNLDVFQESGNRLDSYNESSNNHIENTTSIPVTNKKHIENNFPINSYGNKLLSDNKNNISNYPTNDLYVDDSLLNELTKFTKFALNEGNQTE